jgi:hypothetical protein
MDRERLERYLADELSLEKIGKLEGKDPSTIGYWVKKHGLKANGKARHAPRGAIERVELEALINKGLTLEAIASALDRSVSTVRHWIGRHDLPRPKTIRDEQRLRALAEGKMTFTSDCKHHGSTTWVIENSGRTRCRRCRMQRVTEWRRRSKSKLVAWAGGRCIRCGYNRCLAALQFHHRDRKTKKFQLSNSGVPRSFEQLKREAEKCDLLCANCHAEVEAEYRET